MNNTSIDIPDPSWLPILMNGTSSEIYVMDCDTLYLVHANEAAYNNIQYRAAELASLTLLNVTRGLSEKKLSVSLAPLRANSAECVPMELTLVRRDGTTYPISFRMFFLHSLIIAIGNDQTASIASAKALGLSESRFHAIVSNMPGLVYQFVRLHDGNIAFPYLSDGCHALRSLIVCRIDPSGRPFILYGIHDSIGSHAFSMELGGTNLDRKMERHQMDQSSRHSARD
jgi:two-component system sensor histidine kinase UhpB